MVHIAHSLHPGPLKLSLSLGVEFTPVIKGPQYHFSTTHCLIPLQVSFLMNDRIPHAPKRTAIHYLAVTVTNKPLSPCYTGWPLKPLMECFTSSKTGFLLYFLSLHKVSKKERIKNEDTLLSSARLFFQLVLSEDLYFKFLVIVSGLLSWSSSNASTFLLRINTVSFPPHCWHHVVSLFLGLLILWRHKSSLHFQWIILYISLKIQPLFYKQDLVHCLSSV